MRNRRPLHPSNKNAPLHRRTGRAVPLALVLLTAACSGAGKAGSPGHSGGPAGSGGPGASGGFGGSTTPDSGMPTTPGPPEDEATQRARLTTALAGVANLDAADLATRYPTAFAATLGYDPRSAASLALIRGSRLGLSTTEEGVLSRNGFVISNRMRFPTFTYGYASIYADDLPVFISADSILYAVHQSYDEMLKQLELASLRPTLQTLLEGMRAGLAAGALTPFGADVARDLDLYLTVALRLLTGGAAAPAAGASDEEIASFVAKANAAAGAQAITLFGVERNEDLSQFTPRGHYSDYPELQTYFRSMMWLGRIDFRIIETKSDGSQKFQRRQFDGALGLATLVTPELAPLWTKLDQTIEAFVGVSDNMRAPEFAPLLARLGAADAAATRTLDDATIGGALVAGDLGAQRIASHIMVNGLGKGTLPLSRTFLLLGQRYVVDSHVFSNVVYDRVQRGGAPPRLMPDPLDAAFAVFGNNQAGRLLEPQLTQYRYAPDLASMRLLVDDHGERFWTANLYNGWLAALRALSPPPGGGRTAPLTITGTEAWGRRLLNTQLASWAELRHDTILYVKQSYTGGLTCEFPDALVEPSPEFFDRIGAFAAKGHQVVTALNISGTAATTLLATRAAAYFEHLARVAALLGDMARYQARGTPFTAEQMAFINETVAVRSGGCGPPDALGWYPKLFFGYLDPTAFDPTIADVHTQPTDESGNPVGRVLHVGTGYPRTMVLTANTCNGPRAYVGVVSSYHETVTQNFERLDDPTWVRRLTTATDPAWLSSVIAQ